MFYEKPRFCEDVSSVSISTVKKPMLDVGAKHKGDGKFRQSNRAARSMLMTDFHD
jgi:hypothetical protein